MVQVKFNLKWEKPAKNIALIASFNDFSPDADLLQGPDSAGVWHLQKKLPYGKYEYRFLIAGKKYLRDPNNPYFGGIHSNSILHLDPPEQPQLKVLSPLPGEKIVAYPLNIRIRFLPGSRTDEADAGKSRCLIDGRPVKLKYDHHSQILSAKVMHLAEGEHALSVSLQDKKKYRTREVKSIFLVNAQNKAPVAEAGYDQFCRPDEKIHLNAGLSYDPDLDDLAQFKWKSLDEPEGELPGPFPAVAFQDTGNFRFELRVFDGAAWSQPDTAIVHCLTFPRTVAHFTLNQWKVNLSNPIKSVSVAGEFNHWQAGVDSLQDPDGDGIWELDKAIRPGQYEYKFVINGEQWIPDPGNFTRVEDGWNGVNSVKTVLPAFPESPGWDFNLEKHGLHLENIQAKPFRVIRDFNNPDHSASVADSIVYLGKPAGAYFYYALVKEPQGTRPPHDFLLNNSGSGSGAILDFHQSPAWAGKTVVYQIYLRKFGPDSTQTGTLNFLRKKLDYLQNLGVNCIWLMPIMPSPTEHGYTPTNYFNIEPDYGTLADFDSLLQDLHDRGMKFIFDFVANHSSDQHRYFLSAWWNPHSAFRNWYVWHGPRQYEFHNDWDQLPNLNYMNPNVRHFILKVAKFWIDRGVDGFRCDAAWGVPHDFWKDFRRKVKNWNPQVVLLDEVLPRDPAYHDLEFDMSYDTDFYGNVLDVFSGRKSVEALRFGLQKTRINYPPETVDLRYIENQDMERFNTKFGPEATRAASVLLFTLPGMPLLYYGQETGMREMRGAMQWDRTGSDMFGFYNELIHLRMKHEAFTSEKVTFIISSEPKKLLVYVRKGGGESFLVIINFSNEPLSFNLKIPPAPAAEYVFGDAASIAGNGDSFHNMSLNAYGYLILKLK